MRFLMFGSNSGGGVACRPRREAEKKMVQEQAKTASTNSHLHLNCFFNNLGLTWGEIGISCSGGGLAAAVAWRPIHKMCGKFILAYSHLVYVCSGLTDFTALLRLDRRLQSYWPQIKFFFPFAILALVSHDHVASLLCVGWFTSGVLVFASGLCLS